MGIVHRPDRRRNGLAELGCLFDLLEAGVWVGGMLLTVWLVANGQPWAASFAVLTAVVVLLRK